MYNWFKVYILTPVNVAKFNDVWALVIAGVLAAGITLPANNESIRPWAFGVATIIFNVVVNAIRRVVTE